MTGPAGAGGRPGGTPRAGGRFWLPVAAVLHVGVGIFPISATGLLAPPAGVAAAGVLWLGGLAWLWRTARRGPLALLAPAGTFVAWVALVAFGDAVLGWTA